MTQTQTPDPAALRMERLRVLIRLSREALAGPLGELERRDLRATLAGYETELAWREADRAAHDDGAA